ncbi:MAG: hypothetical protein RML95_01840 [Anaerolineae bacterium]|nr:hypothetical protein [Anaerolineae bacterium]MDW8298057.1 hypothetical protein [Anaerolineae bacterium]
MSRSFRQLTVLTVVIVFITSGAMLLLLSALGNPASRPTRSATLTIVALPSPTPSSVAQSEDAVPAQNSLIALIIGAVSGLLVLMLSLALLRAQRASQER